MADYVIERCAANSGSGVTTFLVGGGPSARAFDLSLLRGCGVVVAINDSFKKLPWADVVFTADGSWLSSRARSLMGFKGEIVAALPCNYAAPVGLQLTRLRRLDGVGLNRGASSVYYADNSGFGALATFAARSRRIVLVGYDMNGHGHWHDGYEWGHKMVSRFPSWARSFDMVAPLLAARGIDVINVNAQSAIRCFRFAEMADVLGGA